MSPAAISRVRLFALRELRTHWGRAVASVGVVAVSAALLVAVLGISGSITGSAERLADGIGGNAALEVSGVTDAGFDASLLDAVGRVPGVAAAVPVLRAQVETASGQALLIGVDRSVEALTSDLEQTVRAQLQPGSPLSRAPNGVVVGPAAGVGQGTEFDVNSTRVLAAVVVTDPAAGRLNGGHFVVAPLALAQRLTGREHRLDSILLVTAPGADNTQIRQAVTTAVAGRALVAEPSFRAAQVSSSFAIVTSMTLLVTLTTFVIAAFLSYNATALAIAQRRPVISTLRALGGRRRTIVGDLLSEAAVLGLIGGVIGSACGIALGRVAIGTLPGTLTQSLEARTEYLLPAYVVPLAVAAAVVTSVIATAVAARQVHNVAPVEALAPIGAGSAEFASRPVRIVAAVFGTVCVAASVVLVTAGIGRVAMASLALAFIGATTIAFALSDPLMRAAAAVARRCGSTGILGATSIERAPRRMLVATITVMIAVANAASVTGTNRNVVDSTLASYASLGKADVWVTASPVTGYQSAPLPPDIEPRVRAVPGVARVTPGQLAFGTVDDIRVMILGAAPGSYQSMYQLLSAQHRAEFDAGRGIALSRDLAERMGTTAGEQIVLQTPSGEHRAQVLQVLPVVAALYGTVALNLQAMRDWYSAPAATNLEVTAAPGTDTESLLREVKAAVPQDVYVYSGPEMLAAVKAAVDANTAAIFTIVWIIIVVSAVTLLNTLMLSVLDRRREIGVLRALGATRRSTVNVIASEAVGVGVVGGLLGLAVGAASQYLAAHALTSVLGIDVSYRPQPAMVAIGLGALVICLLGAVPPAIRAARLNIVEAISVD